MLAIIVKKKTREIMMKIECAEYSTFFSSCQPAFERFEIPDDRLKEWINAFPQDHILIAPIMSKYEAILI